MNNCKDCKHWTLPLLHDQDYCDGPIFPNDPRTYEFPKNEEEEVAQLGYRVRRCKHPRILFYQRPDRDAAAVYDGSEYHACLYTGEDFGCTLWEAIKS